MGHVSISVDEMGLDEMGRHLYSKLRNSKSSFNYPCSFLRNFTFFQLPKIYPHFGDEQLKSYCYSHIHLRHYDP